MVLYARVTTTKGDPSKLEQAIANFKERVLPAMEQATGFAGATLQVDRETGLGAAVGLWESIGAMNAADQLAQQLREQLVQATGGEVLDVNRFEIVIFDTPAEPVLPSYARVVQMYAQPEKVDALINFIKSEAHPRVKEYAGFRAFVLGVNRMTGRAFVSIGFESPEARDATEEMGAALRAKGAEVAGAPEPKVDRREIVVAKRVRALSAA
jgi:hypothetical protein